jgi:glycosyltransferase involved in cell wall biosynthesis
VSGTGEPLRICIVGKYPPIEGGVSATTYWIARALAARGHQIHVVTNADEVEGRYRMRLDASDAEMLQARYQNGGSVRVHHVESFDPRVMAHIPLANPFVTRIASLATEVVRRYDCEAVLAYYFEPYGMAGWFAAQRTGRPLLLKHAGSDLDRLARVPDLAVAYKEIMRDAHAVLTQPALVRRFAGMGVAPDRIVQDPPYPLDPRFFSPDGPVLDIDRVVLGDVAGTATAPHDPGVPTIGVYGKIGVAKGTFDLVAALGCLAAEGRSFRFAAMVGEEFGALLRPHLDDAGLTERTVILPYLPNWRVPEFVRACTAVCFLERDFPVAIHGPMVAREVLACGTCLVLSGEIAGKQASRDGLKSGVHLHVVPDPRNIDELAAALRTVLDDPERARQMGKAGATAVANPGAYDRFVASWEDLLQRYTRQGGGTKPATGRGARRAALDVGVPSLLTYAERLAPAVVDDFLDAAGDPDLPGIALDFCAVLAESLPAAVAVERRPVLVEALRYTVARLHAAFDVPGAPPPFAVVDDLGARAFTLDAASKLYPVRCGTAVVEEFSYDVSGVFPPGAQPSAADADPLDGVKAWPGLVLFQRTPHLVARELAVSPATVALLEVCDGRRTTAEVVDAVAAVHGGGEDVRALVVTAMARLHDLGVVVLGRLDPAWGWRKGARSNLAALPPLRRRAGATDAPGLG